MNQKLLVLLLVLSCHRQLPEERSLPKEEVLSPISSGPGAALPPPISSSETSSGWRWKNPLPQGDALRALWAFSPDEVVQAGLGGALLSTRDAGKTWSVSHLPDRPHISALWATPKGNLFAVGTNGALLRSSDKGKTFSALKSGTTMHLHSIWGDAKGTLFLLGARSTLLRSFDEGETWKALNAPFEELHKIWGNSAGRLVIIGSSGLIMHSEDNGDSWEYPSAMAAYPNGGTVFFRGIWGSGDDVVILGEGGILLRSKDGGHTFTNPQGPKLPKARAMWGDATSLYVLSDNGRLYRSQDKGETFTALSGVTNNGSDLFGLQGDGSPKALFVVGWSGEIFCSTDEGALWREWSYGPRAGFRGAFGDKEGSLFSAGADGALWRISPSLERLETKQTKLLHGLWGDEKGALYAAGDQGLLLRYQLKERSIQETQTGPNHLFSIFGTEAAIVAVGDGGFLPNSEATIVRSTDGITWKPTKSGVPGGLRGVWGREREFFAVGYYGTILYSADAGETWSAQNSPTKNHLYGVWGDASGVFAFGQGGTLLYTKDSGRTWTIKALDKEPPNFVSNDLFAMFGSEGVLYLAGIYGSLWRSTDGGDRWERQESGTWNRLEGLWGSKEAGFYALGEGGTVLYLPKERLR